MKKVLFSFFLLLLFTLCYSQEKVVRVTMKSGATITGTVLEFNPTSHIVLRVAGFESKIDMNDIASVEDIMIEANAQSTSTDDNLATSFLDQGDYPEFCVLKVGPYEIEMILIRGNQFDMGYDGRGSLSMHSEPVHRVQLSSFYVNKSPLDDDLVTYLKTGKESHHDKIRFYGVRSIKDAQNIAELVSEEVGLPVQLISEAQCEYIVTTDNFDKLTVMKGEMVVCRDFYADYLKTSKPQIDPVGPQKGRYVVQRCFSSDGDQAHKRYFVSQYPTKITLLSDILIRVTIPATTVVGE